MRVRLAVFAGVALAVTLTGCTHGMVGIVGLQRVGEHLHAYVKMCDGHSVDSLRMVEREGQFADDWTFAHPVSAVGTRDLGVFDDTVTAIDTGRTFWIQATSTTSDDYANGPDFTSDDLAPLADGEILVQDWKSSDSLLRLDEDEFGELVDAYCG